MTDPFLWALSAAAPEFASAARARLAAAIPGLLDRHAGSLSLVTCQRVELYGTGLPPHVDGLPRGRRGTAVRLMLDGDAVRHACRLAAGLESAIVGEGQVLHQMRRAMRDAATPLPPVVSRTWQAALWSGRRARSGAPTRGDLAGAAIAALHDRLDGLADRTVLVAGTGIMGRRMAEAARSAGARVIVATRTPQATSGGPAVLDLRAAAGVATAVNAVAVALGGTWAELTGATSLPVVVDLSFPSAVPIAARAHAACWIDVDTLAAGARRRDRTPAASVLGPDTPYRYLAHAEQIVDVAADRVEAWVAARPSADVLRGLRTTAEAERRRALNRLFRRLPGLDARERELVHALSEQLVASVLHAPTAALARDVDGSAARAARRLFGG